MNFNTFLDELIAAGAAADEPKLLAAADRRRPRPKPIRSHAADGTLLGFDSTPLAEAIGSVAHVTRVPRSTAPVSYDTPKGLKP